MCGCFSKCLDNRRFKPKIFAPSWHWLLRTTRKQVKLFTLGSLNVSVLLIRAGLTCAVLQYYVSAIVSMIFDILCLCPQASQSMSRFMSAQCLLFVLFSHLQRSGWIRGVREMELRSRRLCHIPHVAFIIEYMHACLHRERPESTALSMPSGNLAFILTSEFSGLEPRGCRRANENH